MRCSLLLGLFIYAVSQTMFCEIISQHFSSCFRYVFFLDPCNLDLINRKIKSVALCVAACPRQELKTISDVQKFAEINGETLGFPSL